MWEEKKANKLFRSYNLMGKAFESYLFLVHKEWTQNIQKYKKNRHLDYVASNFVTPVAERKKIEILPKFKPNRASALFCDSVTLKPRSHFF